MNIFFPTIGSYFPNPYFINFTNSMQVSRTYVQFVKEKPRVLNVASFDCCSSKLLILSLYWNIRVRGSSVSCIFYAVQLSKVIKRSKKYHFRLQLMPVNLEMTQFIFRHKTSISVQHYLTRFFGICIQYFTF